MASLRAYQRQGLECIRTRWQAGIHRQLVRMATGLGKTPLLASLPDALALDRRMLVLVHREELATQVADKLRHWNPQSTVGMEMASRHARATDQLVVASVQTLGRQGSARLRRFVPAEFDAVVIDECHHATAESYQTILRHFRVFDEAHRLCLGLTATPNRADGMGLSSVFQEVVFDMSVLDGIRGGWLADLKGYRILTETALDEVHTRAGDFAPAELERTVNTPTRNQLVARAWLEYGERRQTIVFAVDVKHARDLAATFQSYGVPAEPIWGDDPDRREKLRRHRSGELTVLVNCQVLTEGYDDWRVGCILLARPTQSELLYTQIVGRGIRIPDGLHNLREAREAGVIIAKHDCLLLDVVDLTKRHSLVTLPALFGLNPLMNLRGESVLPAVDEAELIRQARPQANLKQFADLVDLRRYAEQLDLFRSAHPPELAGVSANRWRREGRSSYQLQLANGGSLVVLGGLSDQWTVMGNGDGQKLVQACDSLMEAIRTADIWASRHGGTVRRQEGWRANKPTEAQLLACRRWSIPVPSGATKGDLSDLLDAAISRRRA